MRNDGDIYKDISLILIDVAPQDSIKIKLVAEMRYGDDHCEFEYWATNHLGREDWFTPADVRTDIDLLNLLAELRSYFKTNNLFHDQRPWWGVTLVVDKENSKISLDFSYD